MTGAFGSLGSLLYVDATLLKMIIASSTILASMVDTVAADIPAAKVVDLFFLD
jgi:hypothetical protein